MIKEDVEIQEKFREREREKALEVRRKLEELQADRNFNKILRTRRREREEQPPPSPLWKDEGGKKIVRIVA